MQTPKAKSDVDTRERIRTLKPKVYDKVIHFDEMMATNKPISLIQMQYRYDCNMKCQHCSVSTIQHQPMNGARTLDPSSVKDFCDQADALGWARFEFNGGEPLIVKDFDKVIQAVGPDRFHITTVTNGWLVNESRAKHLKDLGVDRIQVSIDSLNPRTTTASAIPEVPTTAPAVPSKSPGTSAWTHSLPQPLLVNGYTHPNSWPSWNTSTPRVQASCVPSPSP